MKGLTLIEVLVAVGIMVVAGMLLVVIMVNSAGLFTQQSSKVEGGLNSNDALSVLRRDIKLAVSVAESYTSGSSVYTSGAGQLVLKVASINSSGNTIDNFFDYYVFNLNQGIIYLNIFPDALSSRRTSDFLLSKNVDSIRFQYFNSANPLVEVSPTSAVKIRVTLALKQKAGVNFITTTATTEANLRNN